MRRTISLVAGVPPEAVLATARATLERQGYAWTQQDVTRAEAHERGQGRSRLFTFRLRLRRCAHDIDTALTDAGLAA